jgi:hypothetical protein
MARIMSNGKYTSFSKIRKHVIVGDDVLRCSAPRSLVSFFGFGGVTMGALIAVRVKHCHLRTRSVNEGIVGNITDAQPLKT